MSLSPYLPSVSPRSVIERIFTYPSFKFKFQFRTIVEIKYSAQPVLIKIVTVYAVLIQKLQIYFQSCFTAPWEFLAVSWDWRNTQITDYNNIHRVAIQKWKYDSWQMRESLEVDALRNKQFVLYHFG